MKFKDEARNAHIPQYKPIVQGRIPDPDFEGDYCDKKVYYSSFKHYRYKGCELDVADNSVHRKVLGILKALGKCAEIEHLKSIANINSDNSTIKNSSKKSQYETLEKYVKARFRAGDASLRHQDIGQVARMFYVVDQGNKVLHMIQINKRHFRE